VKITSCSRVLSRNALFSLDHVSFRPPLKRSVYADFAEVLTFPCFGFLALFSFVPFSQFLFSVLSPVCPGSSRRSALAMRRENSEPAPV